MPDICHMHHKILAWCQKNCELVCFGIKIIFFCVKSLELVCFLVLAGNGAGVSIMTNMTYVHTAQMSARKYHFDFRLFFEKNSWEILNQIKTFNSEKILNQIKKRQT